MISLMVSLILSCGPYPHAVDCRILQWNGTLENWVPGDCDLDGDWDDEDFELFQIFQTGPCVPWSHSYYWHSGYAVWLLDLDRDGDVDHDDYGLIQRSER